MSATIDIGKLKFSIFGSGFEDNRANSGPGDKGNVDKYALSASSAVLDNTGDFVWFGNHSNMSMTYGLHKYALATFTEVPHSVTTDNTWAIVLHPNNTPNNLGICLQSGKWTVFDLTDDTVYQSITDPGFVNYFNYTREYDCIYDGTYIYVLSAYNMRAVERVWKFDISNGTYTVTQVLGNQGCSGFVDSDIIYGYEPPVWFSDPKKYFAVTKTGASIWSITTYTGTPSVRMEGFGKDGYLYLPSKMYGSWRFGKYKGDITPDLESPKPISYFGKFNEAPVIVRKCYSDERTLVTLGTEIGTYITDFEDVFEVDEYHIPLCMSEDVMIATNETYDYIYVYTLR